MKNLGAIALLAACLSLPANATNVSTADPTYPSSYEDIDAGPLRDQFNKIINDVDNLWAAIGPTFLEANQVLGALASGKAIPVSIPSCSGPTNALTWGAGAGFGCNDIQGGGGPAGTAPALTVLAGPLNGTPATATYRFLTGNDLPLPTTNSVGGVKSIAPIAHQFLTGISTSGSPLLGTPVFSDISGTISPSQIPTPTAGTLGGTQSIAAVAHNFLTSISTQGVPTQAQPAFSDISGNISVSQMASGANASASTFWRGDGAWVPIIGGSNPVAGATAEYPLNEGAGTVVHDISGNGNTAALSSIAPAWTAFGLRFNYNQPTGLNQYVQTPVTSWKTLIINECAPIYALDNSQVLTLAYTFGGKAGQINLSTGLPSILWIMGALYPGIANASSTVTGVMSPTSLCSNIAWVLDTNDHIYIDGNEGSYYSHGSSASNVTIAGGWPLGSLGPGSSASQTFSGHINYAIFYPTALSRTQINQVDSYINGQVYARADYPGNTSVSTSVNSNIICVGDSLSSALAGAPWCNSIYVSTNNAYTFLPAYTGGDAAHFQLAEIAQRVKPQIAVNGAKNYCNLWLGVNDLASGWTAAQTWAALQTIGAEMKRDGCLPIVTTMMSRLGWDSSKNALDALIRANWQNVFVGLNDLAAIPTLGADGASTNPVASCFNDGTHLKNSGVCYNGLAGYPTVGWNLGRLINVLDGTNKENPTATASNAYVEAVADNYVVQTPTASATNQLPECTGLTGTKRSIVNGSGSFAITVNTSAGQTITGSNIIAANAAAEFTCELISPSAAGNYWLRTQ